MLPLPLLTILWLYLIGIKLDFHFFLCEVKPTEAGDFIDLYQKTYKLCFGWISLIVDNHLKLTEITNMAAIALPIKIEIICNKIGDCKMSMVILNATH